MKSTITGVNGGGVAPPPLRKRKADGGPSPLAGKMNKLCVDKIRKKYTPLSQEYVGRPAPYNEREMNEVREQWAK